MVLQKLNQFDQAVESYKSALAIDPTFADANGHLAYLYASRNQISGARKAAAAGLKTKSGDPLMLFVLGLCDRLEGDLVAAKAQFLSLEPALPSGRLLFELLHELAKVLDYVAGVHLKDSGGGYKAHDFPTLGQGVVDFAAVFAQLNARGFTGPFTLAG